MRAGGGETYELSGLIKVDEDRGGYLNSLYAVCVFGVEFRSFSTAHTSSPMPEMTPNVRYVLIMFDITNETFMVFYYVCSSCCCVAQPPLAQSLPHESFYSLF